MKLLLQGIYLDMNIFSNNALILNAAPSADGAAPADDAICHPGIILDLQESCTLQAMHENEVWAMTVAVRIRLSWILTSFV